MMRCPDPDALVTVATALEWDVDAGMSHLLGCASCQETLQQLTRAREALSEERALPAGFVDDVMATLPADANTAPRLARLIAVLNPALAGATTLAVIIVGAGDAMTAPAVPLFAVVGAMVAAAVWNRPRGRLQRMST